MVANIEQVAQDELIAHRTRDLFNTDFADKNKLLTSEHFRIAKTCEPETSLTDCWKTQLTGKDKVIYKLINKSYHTSGIGWKDKTIILKNGIILTYDTRIDPGVQYGCFHFDINGTDKPNIAGRDWFAFCVNKKGHVIAWNMELDPLATKMSNCKIHKYAPYYCYGALADNNWKMDY